MKPASLAQYKRNLIILDKILHRASGPNFWGKVTLCFENGKLRDNFEIKTTLRGNGKSDQDIEGLLDASMGDTVTMSED